MSFDRIKGGFKVVNGSRTVQQQFNGQPMAGLNEESAKSLQELRIIQTNLVFLNGLDIKQSKEEILKKKAFMGQYGNIKKVIVKTEGNRDSNSVGVYISFSHPQEASIAILALDQFELDSKILRAFYGSTKYCNSFLNGTVCGKKECPYLHEKAKDYTFNKDEKFYINYKEIALKVVTSKISFFNNYTATQNPVFPDVAEIIKQARAELASSQPNNALKMIEGNKSSSLMISNMPICTWDEDISEKSEINNQLNSQQQDTNGLKNTLKEVKPNSSPISETASSKAIETFNYLQSQQNKDSNLMEQIISKIEKQQLQLPQQPFPIDLAQYQQSQGIDSQNRFVPPSQSSFISTIPSILQAPWNRNQQKFLTGLSATRFVPINWGPVGSKAYRQNYSLAPKLMLENEEDEQEFEILNQKINETIKIHALNYPAQPYKFSELAKFLVDNYSSLHFKISEYVFGEIWPSETVENIYFTIDDRSIIAYQVSEAFDQQKLALYFPTNLCGHFIDRKEQFEEIEQVFANFPNKIIRQESNHQRKRSSNSLQSTNPSSSGGGEQPEVFLEEPKIYENNRQQNQQQQKQIQEQIQTKLETAERVELLKQQQFPEKQENSFTNTNEPESISKTIDQPENDNDDDFISIQKKVKPDGKKKIKTQFKDKVQKEQSKNLFSILTEKEVQIVQKDDQKGKKKEAAAKPKTEKKKKSQNKDVETIEITQIFGNNGMVIIEEGASLDLKNLNQESVLKNEEVNKDELTITEKKQKQSADGTIKKGNLKKSSSTKPAALTKQQEEKKLIYEQLQVILEEKKRIKQKELDDKLFQETQAKKRQENQEKHLALQKQEILLAQEIDFIKNLPKGSEINSSIIKFKIDDENQNQIGDIQIEKHEIHVVEKKGKETKKQKKNNKSMKSTTSNSNNSTQKNECANHAQNDLSQQSQFIQESGSCLSSTCLKNHFKNLPQQIEQCLLSSLDEAFIQCGTDATAKINCKNYEQGGRERKWIANLEFIKDGKTATISYSQKTDIITEFKKILVQNKLISNFQ